MAQQAAIAQKPTRAEITLSNPLRYDTIAALEDNIRDLRLECFKWEQKVMAQADIIKSLRSKLFSLK